MKEIKKIWVLSLFGHSSTWRFLFHFRVFSQNPRKGPWFTKFNTMGEALSFSYLEGYQDFSFPSFSKFVLNFSRDIFCLHLYLRSKISSPTIRYLEFSRSFSCIVFLTQRRTKRYQPPTFFGSWLVGISPKVCSGGIPDEPKNQWFFLFF